MASLGVVNPDAPQVDPARRSTADRDRMQIEDLRGVEDPRDLDLFR
jgi:hypothetical protein